MQILELILKLLPILGILTFLKAILDYSNDLKWKRSHFLSEQIKDFETDTKVKIALKLLDWNKRKVNLELGEVVIADSDLILALKTHNQKSEFTQTEAELRDIFDTTFSKLGTFNIYLKCGLISEKELKSYISYWIDILTTPGRKPKELVDTFSDYLKYYNYTDTLELFKRF